jgi:hypothetical protein
VIAGERAMAAGVAATAEGYLEIARDLFAESDWEAHAELGFRLYDQSIEGALQNAEYEKTLALIDVLEPRITQEIPKAAVVAKRISVHGAPRPSSSRPRDGARATAGF